MMTEKSALTSNTQQQQHSTSTGSTFQPPVSIYQQFTNQPNTGNRRGNGGADDENKSTNDDQYYTNSFEVVSKHTHRWALFKLTSRKMWWIYAFSLVHMVILYSPLFLAKQGESAATAFTCDGFPDTNTTMNVSCSFFDGYIFDPSIPGAEFKNGKVKAIVDVPCNSTTNRTILRMVGDSSSFFYDPLHVYQNVGVQIWFTMPIEDVTFLWWILCSVWVAAVTLPRQSEDPNTATVQEKQELARRRAKMHRYATIGLKVCTVLYIMWKTSWILVGTTLLFNVCAYSVTPKHLLFAAYYFYILELLIVMFSPVLMRNVLQAASQDLACIDQATALKTLEAGDVHQTPSTSDELGFVGCESSGSLLAQQQQGDEAQLLSSHHEESPSIQL